MATKFTARRIRFGEPPRDDDEDDGRDLPRPALLRLQARRAAGIAEAKDMLAVLPAPGESLHAIFTARLDMTDILNAMLEKLGRCDELAVATLGFNRKNFRAMLRWLDEKRVSRLTLLASRFFQAHNRGLWDEVLTEFRNRGQRAACAPSHCKVATLAFATGQRFAAEGSSNLCSNGSSRENVCIVNDAALHDWHRGWIDAMVSKHGQCEQATG